MIQIVGWDIGGANVKAAWLACDHGKVLATRVASRAFEIWRNKDHLPEVLQDVWAQVSPDFPPQAMAITMTAELADIFATKREGVHFVLDSVRTALPAPPSYALSLSGKFVPLTSAMEQPLDFAAANWLATALWISHLYQNCLVIDVGSTTTDILPILDGKICTPGRKDMDRLISGELVYTGALRTNLAAIVRSVPVRGSDSRVASEYFAISGDVHLILGHITPEDYTCPTPDGRPPTIDFARQRVARLVCADTEMLGAEEIDEIARYIGAQQIQQICQAILQVCSRFPSHNLPVVALGSGKFLAVAASRCLGTEIWDLPTFGDDQVSAVAPCVAAACILAGQLETG